MNRVKKISQNFFLHIHSPKVHVHSLQPSFTFGLGIISACLFLILIVTGGLLLTHYTPSIERAYASVKEIIFIVPGGRMLRNMHHWAGHALVIIAFLHMLRVFYTAGYQGRRKNWIFGVAMFVIIIAAGFSGYLLPWDQLAYWAVTIGTNIAASFRELTDMLHITTWLDIGGFLKRLLIGSETVGQPALSRFFTLHVFILPLALFTLTMLHFWRIRKDGGLAHPAEAEKKYGEKTSATVYSWPVLLWAEFALLIVTFTFLFGVSACMDAPLREIANPTLPENPAKSAWFLLGIQELVSYSAFSGGILIPVLFIAFLIAIPFFDRQEQFIGQWFSGQQGKRIALQTALTAAAWTILLFIIHIQFNWFQNMPAFLVLLVNPGTLMCLAYVLWARYIFIKTQSSRMAMLALFTAAIISLIILTIIGVYFRGPNWNFFWHKSLWTI